jgi:hypothetical protein
MQQHERKVLKKMKIAAKKPNHLVNVARLLIESTTLLNPLIHYSSF